MLIGSTSIYLNHRVIRIGSTLPPDDVLQLQGAPLVASDRHVQISARAQVGLVRVRLWSKMGQVGGTSLFDGVLLFEDGAIAVGDILGVSSYIQKFGTPGEHRIAISVDDPGLASRIDVVLDSGAERVKLTAVGGYPLPMFTKVDGSVLGKSDELGLILSAHDLPLNRLAAAVKLIRLASEGDEPARVEVLRKFRIRMICEWLRWLSADLALEECTGLGEFISGNLQGVSVGNLDSQAVEISAEVIKRASRGDGAVSLRG